MQRILKKITPTNILIVCAFTFIFYCIFYSLSTLYLNGDSLHEGIQLHFSNFLKPIHGRYFAEILERAIGIGNYFGIHPMDYINTYGAISIAFVYTIICYVITSASNINSKKTILFPLFMIFIYITTLKIECIEYTSWTQFWGYSAQLIFLFLAWTNTIKIYITKEIPKTKKEIIKLSIIAFFLGMACEYMNISFLILLILILMFETIVNIKNIKNHTQNVKNNLKKLIIPMFCFFTTFFAAYLNPFFWEHAKQDKGIEITQDLITNSLTQIITLYKDFFNMLIGNHIIIISIISICTLAIFCNTENKKGNKRFVSIITLIFISLLMFFFILLTLGKSEYNGGESYLNHAGLQLLYKTSLLYLITCTVGKLFTTYNTKLTKITFLMIFIGIFIPFSKIDGTIRYVFDYRVKENLEIRKKWYIIDYLVLEQNKKNNTIYIPFEYIKILNNTDYFYNIETRTLSDTELMEKFSKEPANEAMSNYVNYIHLAYNIHPADLNEIYMKDETIENNIEKNIVKKVNFQNLKSKYCIISRDINS